MSDIIVFRILKHLPRGYIHAESISLWISSVDLVHHFTTPFIFTTSFLKVSCLYPVITTSPTLVSPFPDLSNK